MEPPGLENLLGVPSAVLRVHISRTFSVLRWLTDEVDLYPGFPSAVRLRAILTALCPAGLGCGPSGTL